MRFMMIVKSNKDTEAGKLPSSEVLAKMGRYNDELIAAGILLAADGLKPSKDGARIKQSGGKVVVTDGPFAEAKELIAGFWMIDVKSKEEALAWARKVPLDETGEIELRPVYEATDFPADAVSEETLKKEQAWRDANQKPVTR